MTDRPRSSTLILATLLVPGLATAADKDWPQWGGPHRNFTVETSGLADKWPESGPPRIWHRELGDGYSSIVCDEGVLYTLYRANPSDNDERFVALDAKTGKTVWEHVNPAKLWVRPDERWGGLGPNSTPLVVGERLYAVGSTAKLFCFKKATGEVLWSHDLASKYGAPYPNGGEVGHSPSPVAYENLVIVAAGNDNSASARKSQALIAFEQTTGREIWKGYDLDLAMSSPILIRFGDLDQLVLYARPGLVGADPQTGRQLWSVPLSAEGAMLTPVFDGEDLIFYAAEGDTPGMGAIRLTQDGSKILPEVVWTNKKLRTAFPTPVAVAGYLFGSTDTVLYGESMATGKRVWVRRGFPSASCVYGGGKLIILDENGKLTLATATAENLTVHSQHTVTEKYSLTAPTLVGTTLYVRDRKHIMALDLGKPHGG